MMNTQKKMGVLGLVAGTIGALAATGAAHAGTECTPEWLPGAGVPGVDGLIYTSTMWDPDGPGSQPAVLVVGGEFSLIGGVLANNIAAWDGTSWHALAGGTKGTSDASVKSLATLPNGDLAVGGRFTSVDGDAIPAAGIARWNGSAWSALEGGGFATGTAQISEVNALVVMPNDDLIAGGSFLLAGGNAVSRVARWNGTAWSPLSGGVSGIVSTLTVWNGNLVVGGSFGLADGMVVNRIATWDGTSWSSMAGGVGSAVYALTTLPNGDLLVGGRFTTAGGMTANRIAVWNGTAWSAYAGAGMDNEYIRAFVTMPNGDVVAAGNFTAASGVSASRIARWNGSAWSPLGTGVDSTINTLLVTPDGGVLAGGSFTTAGGLASPYLARWGCPPAPACAADFNNVNGVTVQDIFDFLTAWLSGSPSADFNNVNGVTVQDIFDFLTAWLAGC